jgi:hypothetical protein
MHRFVFLSGLILMVGFLGCEGGLPPGAVLRNDAETIHDEAMKDLTAMNRVGKELKNVLKGMDTTAADQQPLRDAIVEAVANIEKTEEEMYAWMAGYERTTDPSGPDGERYFMVQKQKIEQNHRAIREATAAGEKLLKQE